MTDEEFAEKVRKEEERYFSEKRKKEQERYIDFYRNKSVEDYELFKYNIGHYYIRFVINPFNYEFVFDLTLKILWSETRIHDTSFGYMYDIYEKKFNQYLNHVFSFLEGECLKEQEIAINGTSKIDGALFNDYIINLGKDWEKFSATKFIRPFINFLAQSGDEMINDHRPWMHYQILGDIRIQKLLSAPSEELRISYPSLKTRISFAEIRKLIMPVINASPELMVPLTKRFPNYTAEEILEAINDNFSEDDKKIILNVYIEYGVTAEGVKLDSHLTRPSKRCGVLKHPVTESELSRLSIILDDLGYILENTAKKVKETEPIEIDPLTLKNNQIFMNAGQMDNDIKTSVSENNFGNELKKTLKK